jgi:hypothetical protein
MHLRFKAAPCEVLVCELIGTQELLFGPILVGDGRDEVGIVDVEYDKVSMASSGRDGEASGLIGVDLARDLVGGHVDQVSHDVVGFLGDHLLSFVVGKEWDWFECGASASLTLACLVHVSLGSSVVDGDVAASPFCG